MIDEIFALQVRYGVTLGYPLSQAKWLMVTRGLTTFVARLIAGRLNDIFLRHGKVKMVTQITFVFFGVLNFVCSFLRSFPLLLVYMALIGMVEGVWWVTYPILVMEITGGYYYNEAFSLVCFIVAFAILLGPPTLGTVESGTLYAPYIVANIFVRECRTMYLFLY